MDGIKKRLMNESEQVSHIHTYLAIRAHSSQVQGYLQ
jgi:hypothetical protein